MLPHGLGPLRRMNDEAPHGFGPERRPRGHNASRQVCAEGRCPTGVAERLEQTQIRLIVGGQELEIIDRRRRIDAIVDRKSTRLNSSHYCAYRMPSSV